MRSKLSRIQSAILLVVAMLIAILAHNLSGQAKPRAYSHEMRQAAWLCAQWFDRVEQYKGAAGITSDSYSTTRYNALLGDDYTPLTTTLGSLESKETAANPEFSALILRLFFEAGMDSTSTIGVTLSGSFPSLGIAVLAAATTLGAETVVLSSLGASSFGANQPGATWLDLEAVLRRDSLFDHVSRLVTFGAENDNGGGMTEDGILLLRQVVARHGIVPYMPDSLYESILYKTHLLRNDDIDLLVNIGGNQASMGLCPDAYTIPNGLQMNYQGSMHPNRGVIVRLAEAGIPFIHLLNIRDLAVRYELPLAPGPSITPSHNLYQYTQTNTAIPVVGIGVLIGLLVSFRVADGLRIGRGKSRDVSEITAGEDAIRER